MALPTFKRGRAALWTREKIEPMTTLEIRQLLANAERLGEPGIAALCDEVLGERPRGRAVERKPTRKRAMSGLATRNAALGARGVVPKNRNWSRSGVREGDGAVVLTLWAEDVQRSNHHAECLLWAPNVDGARPWSDTRAGQERLAHCRLALARSDTEGLLAYGVRIEGTLPEEKVLHLDGLDVESVVTLRVEQRGEEFWAVWDGASPAGAAPAVAEAATA